MIISNQLVDSTIWANKYMVGVVIRAPVQIQRTKSSNISSWA